MLVVGAHLLVIPLALQLSVCLLLLQTSAIYLKYNHCLSVLPVCLAVVDCVQLLLGCRWGTCAMIILALNVSKGHMSVFLHIHWCSSLVLKPLVCASKAGKLSVLSQLSSSDLKRHRAAGASLPASRAVSPAEVKAQMKRGRPRVVSPAGRAV